MNSSQSDKNMLRVVAPAILTLVTQSASSRSFFSRMRRKKQKHTSIVSYVNVQRFFVIPPTVK